MKKKRGLWILLFAVVILYVVSSTSYKDSVRKRAERAERAKGDIVIGVVWPTSVYDDLFDEGVTMAVDELNGGGGVLGRKIKTVIYDDESSVGKGKKIAKKFADNPDVVAVVGHADSDVAIPASVTYEYNGIVFISPGATSPVLTHHDFQYIFRSIPSDVEAGNQLANLAYRKGFKKVAVLYVRNSYGKGLADNFFVKAVELGIDVPTTRSYYAWQKDFKPLIAEVKKTEFDAIFLAGAVPLAAKVMKQAREMGVTAPFFGGDGLDAPELWKVAGKTAEGTIVSTVFDPNQPAAITQQFNRKFYSRFKTYPDTWAAQGYDAVKLLAFAFERSRSTVPIVVSSTLRYIEKWQGVAGSYSFNINGDIIEKPIFFKVLRNGKFEYLKEE